MVVAYLNTCRHQGLTLDFGDAHFFDDAYDALVCCQHGARYDPLTGVCVAGPCVGVHRAAVTQAAQSLQGPVDELSPRPSSPVRNEPDPAGVAIQASPSWGPRLKAKLRMERFGRISWL